eukprot:GDKJ01022040.1.p1 GENE.GDKJ01022040.1~~GDKJ01022040.1.p1  ORF type:complete len:386 (+),score=74.89 GDKJ01022040.1:1-1158(+)
MGIHIPLSKMSAIADFRSDTFTKPTPAMRQAMMDAEVGDDVWNEDPTVQLLEKYASELTGKEAALFLPTATMSNLIAVTYHCNSRDSEVLLGDKSHIHVFEQGAISTWGGVHPRTVRNLPDGTLDLADLKSKFRDSSNVHFPVSKLICLENTHNLLGGCVIPLEHIKDIRAIADAHNCKMHLDGARVFHAASYLNLPLSTLLQPFDTVTLCLSKGLGAPIGSLLLGTTECIKQARRMRKALGGGMRQVGVIAAPCMIALRDMRDRLETDHIHAKMIGTAMNECKDVFGMEVNMETTHTNIVFCSPTEERLSAAAGQFKTPAELCQMFASLDESLLKEGENPGVVIKCAPLGDGGIRFVTHFDISRELVDGAVYRIKAVAAVLRRV